MMSIFSREKNLEEMKDTEYARLTGLNPENRRVTYQGPMYPQRPGIIPGLAGLARGASNIMDLFFNAKKLARAEDNRARKRALDNIGKMDQT